MKKPFLLLGLFALLMPGNAAAQTWDDVRFFLDQCVIGSFRPCGSVVVKTRATGSGTVVEMMVRNEQGTNSNDNTGGSFLTAIGLTAPQIEGASDPSVSTVGAVGQVGDPAGFWTRTPNIGGRVEFSSGTSNGKQGAIRGCDQPNGATADYFITCDNPGVNDGWVVFSFATTNAWTASDAQVALKYQSVGPDGVSLECRTADSTGESACGPTVVPEPSTYALMFTGLLGIFAMARYKRGDATRLT